MTPCIFLIVIYELIHIPLTKKVVYTCESRQKITVARRASHTECKFRTYHYFRIGIVCTEKCEKVGIFSASKIVQPCFHEIMYSYLYILSLRTCINGLKRPNTDKISIRDRLGYVILHYEAIISTPWIFGHGFSMLICTAKPKIVVSK